ncbi:4982_t:CDS:2, partial [Gigaspora margarita]
MYNEENTPKIYNNQYMENKANFSQSQTNISLLNVYNNPSKEWYDYSNQDYAKQTYNNMPTERSPNFTQDQTNINLLKTYNKPFMTLSPSFTQSHENQTNNNFTKEWSEDFTQNYENQANNNLFAEFKENENLTSLASRHTKRQCKKCNRMKVPCDKNSDQCRDCYGASLRVLSGGFSVIYKATWVDGPITRWSSKKQKYNRKSNYTVVLKCLNNSKKMDSDCLNEVNLKNFISCKNPNYNDQEKGEIKFPENIDVKSSPTKINEQAIYSSRLLNPLISEALTIRSMKLNFNGGTSIEISEPIQPINADFETILEESGAIHSQAVYTNRFISLKELLTINSQAVCTNRIINDDNKIIESQENNKIIESQGDNS